MSVIINVGNPAIVYIDTDKTPVKTITKSVAEDTIRKLVDYINWYNGAKRKWRLATQRINDAGPNSAAKAQEMINILKSRINDISKAEEAAKVETDRVAAAAVAVAPIVKEMVASGVPVDTAIKQVSAEATKVISAPAPTPAPAPTVTTARIESATVAVAPIVTALVNSGVPVNTAIDMVSSETAKVIVAAPVPAPKVEAAIPAPAPAPAPVTPAKVDAISVAVAPIVKDLVASGVPVNTAIETVSAEAAKQISVGPVAPVEPVKTVDVELVMPKISAAATPLVKTMIDAGIPESQAIKSVTSGITKVLDAGDAKEAAMAFTPIIKNLTDTGMPESVARDKVADTTGKVINATQPVKSYTVWIIGGIIVVAAIAGVAWVRNK